MGDLHYCTGNSVVKSLKIISAIQTTANKTVSYAAISVLKINEADEGKHLCPCTVFK